MDGKPVSRRQAVGLVDLGLASAAGGLSMAQQTPPQPDGPMAKEDPRTKYPKPPFPEQRNPGPPPAILMTMPRPRQRR